MIMSDFLIKLFTIIFLVQRFVHCGAGISKPQITLAIKNGNENIARILLGDESLLADEFYDEALITAIDFDQSEIAELLLKNDRVNPAARDNYAITSRFAMKNERILKMLLETGKVDAAAQNNRAIILAAENGNVNVVKILLRQKSVDPSARSNLAIQKAVKSGREDVVKLLLDDKRVNPADDDNAAIRNLNLFLGPGFEKRFDTLKLLLKDGRADPSVNNNEILTRMKNVGNVPVIKLLESDERVHEIEYLNSANNALKSTTFLKLVNSPLKWGTPSYVESLFVERPNDLVAQFCSDLFKIPLAEAKLIRNLDDFDNYIQKMSLMNEKSLLSEKKREFLLRYYGETFRYKDHSLRFQELTINMINQGLGK